jgi:hypothetical protein
MDALKTLMLEGKFFVHPKDGLTVKPDQGAAVNVPEALGALKGRQIRLALMHVPPDGAKPDKWGCGSCNLERTGKCHAGHHEQPTRMFVFTGEGVLAEGSTGWVLRRFDGGTQEVPLNMMWGHYGRVVAATTDAVERMRDKLAGLDPEQQVEALSGQAKGLRDVLARLQKATRRK